MEKIIQPGGTIGQWLALGPIPWGRGEDIVEDSSKILTSSHHKGEIFDSPSGKNYWEPVCRDEKYIAFGSDYESLLLWNKGYIPRRYAAVFLSNVIIPERAGATGFKIVTFTDIRAIIAVNGSIIYDKEISRDDNLYFEDQIEVMLNGGENTFNVCLLDAGKAGHLGIMLELIDNIVEVTIPGNPESSRELEEQVEKEIKSLRLEKDLFYPEDRIKLHSDTGISCKLSLLSRSGESILEKDLINEKDINLCYGKELEDGNYKIICIWKDDRGNYIASTSFNIIKLTPANPIKGAENLETREKLTLEYFASNPVWGRDEIWAQVARYKLGLDVDEEIIKRACEYIKIRRDCSDFIMQAILRLMYWEKEKPRLSPRIRELMKEAILGFRYWIDEPGERTMYMDTENHRFLFHTAEWLAGILFPTEEFTNSQQNGLYHSLKGRMYLAEWLKERTRFGFDEWHSNSYYPVVFAGLANIYDFAPKEEYKIKIMAKHILDYIFFILAQDTFHGVFGTTHGRCYGTRIKYPDCDESSSLCWLLYGEGNLCGGGMAGVSVATSTYRIPELVLDIASDQNTIVESYERQGLISYRDLSANLVVYKTPDYMISSVQDFQKGEYLDLIREAEILKPGVAMYWSFPYTQMHVAQVTLENKVVIFWSCPVTSEEGTSLRPDYWAGNIVLPRAIQYRNVLALIWKQGKFSWMTHCLFEKDRFDEVYMDDRWAFARVKDGYVGIYSQNGFNPGERGQYTGRELICYAGENIWLAECGRKEDWGSFSNFIESIKRADIESVDGGLVYNSPSAGRFLVGWDIEPSVNGEKIKIKDYPLLESPYGYSAFGSGHITLRFKDQIEEIFS